ncbi:hypothetical protein D1872_270430 [compost metagenome]
MACRTVKSVRNLMRLASMFARSPSFFSTAKTWPFGASRVHSTATEPEPAPMSHTTLSSRKHSSDRLNTRTSRFVIKPFSGFHWWNSSSAKPNPRRAGGASLRRSKMTTFSGLHSVSASSSSV